jgi:hypothetical protein
MQQNIERWPRNTIALPVCAGHLIPANSTCAWNKNSGRLRTVRNACKRRVPKQFRHSFEPLALYSTVSEPLMEFFLKRRHRVSDCLGPSRGS